jgi:hypothetical protein
MVKQVAPGRQLVAFLVGKVGLRDAVKVATFLIQWGTVARKMGREPIKEEYCLFWRESMATYYRDLKRMRKVWPDERTPQAKWEWVEANVKLPRNLRDDRAVLALLQSPLR